MNEYILQGSTVRGLGVRGDNFDVDETGTLLRVGHESYVLSPGDTLLGVDQDSFQCETPIVPSRRFNEDLRRQEQNRDLQVGGEAPRQWLYDWSPRRVRGKGVPRSGKRVCDKPYQLGPDSTNFFRVRVPHYESVDSTIVLCVRNDQPLD